MLWKKETNRGNEHGNEMYIDLFQTTSSVYTKYKLNCLDRLMYRRSGDFRKKDTTAELCRKKGNELFANDEFIPAMELYNKSLCFAENDSKAIGLAYANRSTCFMKMNMFEKCLADIELAKQNKYPADLMGKLERRKLECLELMKTEEDRSKMNVPKLDFEPNEKFPCLAEVVEIRSNEEYGRHLAATDDIAVGKTVLVEQCYIGVTKDNLYISCNICLKIGEILYPCEKCTTALFCGDCKGNDLHGIECNMNFGCPPGFNMMDLTRSVSLAKNAFANADQLMTYVEDMLNGNALELPSNFVDARSKYRAFFKLCPEWNSYELTLEDTYLFYRLLLEQDSMKAFFPSKVHKRFLMHLVQHHNFMILFGSFNKRTKPISGRHISETFVNIIAKHLNFSRNPNCILIFESCYIRCGVIRPIKKNEPLRISCRTVRNAEEILEGNCKCRRCHGRNPLHLLAMVFLMRNLNLFS